MKKLLICLIFFAFVDIGNAAILYDTSVYFSGGVSVFERGSRIKGIWYLERFIHRDGYQASTGISFENEKIYLTFGFNYTFLFPYRYKYSRRNVDVDYLFFTHVIEFEPLLKILEYSRFNVYLGGGVGYYLGFAKGGPKFGDGIVYGLPTRGFLSNLDHSNITKNFRFNGVSYRGFLKLEYKSSKRHNIFLTMGWREGKSIKTRLHAYPAEIENDSCLPIPDFEYNWSSAVIQLGISYHL